MTWGKFRNGTKFGNKKRKGLDGYDYHSQLEAAVADILFFREKAGEVRVLKRQQHIHYYATSADDAVKIGEFWPDFTVLDLALKEIYWIEAKGYEQDTWAWKRNCWNAGGPGRLEIWKGDHRKPKLHRTIVPLRPGWFVNHEQVYGKLEIA